MRRDEHPRATLEDLLSGPWRELVSYRRRREHVEREAGKEEERKRLWQETQKQRRHLKRKERARQQLVQEKRIRVEVQARIEAALGGAASEAEAEWMIEERMATNAGEESGSGTEEILCISASSSRPSGSSASQAWRMASIAARATVTRRSGGCHGEPSLVAPATFDGALSEGLFGSLGCLPTFPAVSFGFQTSSLPGYLRLSPACPPIDPPPPPGFGPQ